MFEDSDDKEKYNDLLVNLKFTTFIYRGIVDFLTSLACLFLFYKLGMRRLMVQSKTERSGKYAEKEIMRALREAMLEEDRAFDGKRG